MGKNNGDVLTDSKAEETIAGWPHCRNARSAYGLQVRPGIVAYEYDLPLEKGSIKYWDDSADRGASWQQPCPVPISAICSVFYPSSASSALLDAPDSSDDDDDDDDVREVSEEADLQNRFRASKTIVDSPITPPPPTTSVE